MPNFVYPLMSKARIYRATTGNAVTTQSQDVINHGVMRAGNGTVGSNLLANKAFGDSKTRIGNIVSLVRGSAHDQVFKALSSGTFNGQVAGKYIITRVTNSLAGVANTVLQFSSHALVRHSIHLIQNVRFAKLSALSWTANTDGMPSYSFTNTDYYTPLANDVAAHPSLANPGRIVYKTVKPIPNTAYYSAKTD